jgi:hypothetical protein
MNAQPLGHFLDSNSLVVQLNEITEVSQLFQPIFRCRDSPYSTLEKFKYIRRTLIDEFHELRGVLQRQLLDVVLTLPYVDPKLVELRTDRAWVHALLRCYANQRLSTAKKLGPSLDVLIVGSPSVSLDRS